MQCLTERRFGTRTYNIDSFLGLDREIIEQRKPSRTVTGNIRTAIEEYFREHNALRPVYEKRTITTD